ncbi:MAG: 3-(methylthio)propionyl---CoA ligase, partial [Sphingomonadales bacterium]|nr:3-(methylthio)propionyl---CoA ligase [Sphingomonadales bacterium]
RPVVWRSADGRVERATYSDLRDAAGRISNSLRAHNIGLGDRVATLAFNSFDHLACWYGIMGIGATCHTLNPRLHADQLRYIVNHASDRFIFVDAALASLVIDLLPDCPTIEKVVVLGDEGVAPTFETLSEFTAGCQSDCVWGGFGEETAAGLCYTSGTTGDPKGVLYSHRSNYLHTLHTIAPDAFALSCLDVILPVVPMFHANTWGLAFSAPFVGSKLVLPGPMLDGRSLHELIESEGVTFSAGVPTVWQGYVDHLAAEGVTSTSLRRVVVGGSACPEILMDAFEALGVEVLHAWGMTELSPVGLVASPKPEIADLPPEARKKWRLKQGRPIGIDISIVDDSGKPMMHDGEAAGKLMVRGPAVAERYLGHDESALTGDGWFDTGDVAIIDQLGYVRITDRAKDIIKSGGEWISSVDIENIVMSHPEVAQAAVVAIPHGTWGERPKLYVQLRRIDGNPPPDLKAFLIGKIAKWWMPDEVEIIDSIPLGATGKVDKKALRGSA